MVLVTELGIVTCFCVIKKIVYTVVVNNKFRKDEDRNIIPLLKVLPKTIQFVKVRF